VEGKDKSTQRETARKIERKSRWPEWLRASDSNDEVATFALGGEKRQKIILDLAIALLPLHRHRLVEGSRF
jgi:hypothetical protein